jgi:glycosyltransferase involved in cell wall biosynthesis
MTLSPPFSERLLAGTDYSNRPPPSLTVAIPHYNHRSYLEVVLDSLFSQDDDRFEIVVSDDGSSDDSNQIIPGKLERSSRPFRYYAQPSNLGYDGNVRFCLAAARGHHVLLLGNDDALAGPRVLRELVNSLDRLDHPEVAFANFEDWSAPGAVVRRATSTTLLGAGPESAVRFFRSFSFVSGLIFEREAAARHETDRWDRSIYYQIYLASRIQAAGGRLAALDLTLVRKDVRVEGKQVPNYASKWSNAPRSFQSRHTGLDSVVRVTVDAVLPFVPSHSRSSTIRRITAQVLVSSYAFWLFEYRRIANWSFAVGVARSMWPSELLREYRLARHDRVFLWLVYACVSCAGLLVPVAVLSKLSSLLSVAVRHVQQRAKSTA